MFCDRYYTSIPLALTLADYDTGFVGTCVKNRIDLPDEVRDKGFRLANDETKAYRAQQLLVTSWRAAKKKKPVIMLTTEGCAAPVDVVTRQGHTTKPSVVNDYNQSMYGVDKADQNSVYYAFIRKSKWW